MKIISWNIWGGKHLDEVLSYLQEKDADIITLQEVKVQDRKNSATIIGEKLGYYVTYCKSFTTDRHTPPYELGNAILTKEKPLTTTCHILSDMSEYKQSAQTEPRTAVEVTLPFAVKPLTILTTHLGYSEKFVESDLRNSQLEKLLSIMKNKNHLVLTGDFNSLPASSVVRKVSEVVRNVDKELTQMSMTDYKDENQTRYRIDYIFVSDSLRDKNFSIGESKASDHTPLSIEIDL